MKKEKMMLTSILIFTIISAALAFKVRVQFFFYQKQGNTCFLAGKINPVPGGPFVFKDIYTTVFTTTTIVYSGLCTSTVSAYIEE